MASEVVASHVLHHLLCFVRGCIHGLGCHLLAFELLILARNIVESFGLLLECVLDLTMLVL
jgi:hypothetical protein